MATLDPRYGPELERYQDVAAPFLSLVDAPDPAWPGSNAEAAGPIAARIPDEAIGAVSVTLLRRIVESDLATGMSLPGEVRAALAKRRMEPDPDKLALELALCAVGIDPGGFGLARLRLHLYDPILACLERMAPTDATPGLVQEVEAAVELLASPDFDASSEPAETADRRGPLVAFLVRLRPDSLPPIAFDDGDGYGATMRALVVTDDKLASDLAASYPLIAQGTTILPTKRWSDAAAAQLRDGTLPWLGSTLVRSLRPLLELDPPPMAGLPGMAKALRLTNQRLVRGMLWLVSRVDPEWASNALVDIGIKLGTSGRHDNTALDGAVASTCAALLGEIGTPQSGAGLARMQARITNRLVGKQIAAALERLDEFAGAGVGPVGDAILPTFELDADGRRSIDVGDWTALLQLAPDGTVTTTWRSPNGQSSTRPPISLRNDRPGEVKVVAELVKRVRAAIADERGRVELDFASARVRPLDAWQTRWLDHPIGRVFARRLVWRFEDGGDAVAGLPIGPTTEDAAGRPIHPSPTSTVRLWHPVEAESEAVDAWRQRIVASRITQPVKQVFRETYRPGAQGGEALLDRRFAGRALDQRRLRVLMRERRWTGAVLGPWDQGHNGAISLDVVATDWHAELTLEAVGRGDHREAVTVVRSGSLRFVHGRGQSAAPATIDRVPSRILSEVFRDVDLFTAVADITRRSPSRDASGDGADPSAIIACRAAIIRALMPTMPFASRLSVFGSWLRVEGPPDHAISLVDGRALSLPDETDLDPSTLQPTAEATPGYLPTSDDATLVDILDLARRLAHQPR
jgi:hypothetical protein